MQFESLAAMMSMGGHGPYVWAAYGIFLAVLAGCLVWCRMRRTAIIRQLQDRALAQKTAQKTVQKTVQKTAESHGNDDGGGRDGSRGDQQ